MTIKTTDEIITTLQRIPEFYQGGELDYEGLARHIFSLNGLAQKLVNECEDTPAHRQALRYQTDVQKYLSAINDDDIPSKATFDELSHNMTESLLSVYIIYTLSGE